MVFLYLFLFVFFLFPHKFIPSSNAHDDILNLVLWQSRPWVYWPGWMVNIIQCKAGEVFQLAKATPHFRELAEKCIVVSTVPGSWCWRSGNKTANTSTQCNYDFYLIALIFNMGVWQIALRSRKKHSHSFQGYFDISPFKVTAPQSKLYHWKYIQGGGAGWKEH